MAAETSSPDLFNASLLCTTPDVPSSLIVRPLTKADHTSGFLACLQNLTTVGDITEPMFAHQFDFLQAHHSAYIICLADPKKHGTPDEVVACGTLLLEHKFIHKLGQVGHIEDIACREGQQGKGYGKVIILALKALAQQLSCYKVILDCSESNAGFYEKCGFGKKGLEMACYFSK